MYEKLVGHLDYVARNRRLEGMPIEVRVMPLHCFFENSENQDLKALVLRYKFYRDLVSTENRWLTLTILNTDSPKFLKILRKVAIEKN